MSRSEAKMRLIPRHRHHRAKAPRIEISEAEISADLHYPAPPVPQRRLALAPKPEDR
jgi:hypothetical protein